MPRFPLPVFAIALLAVGPLGCTDPERSNPAPADEPSRIEGTFTLVDDGAADAGFAAFRDSLRAVIARRDTAALLAAVGPGARLSFGDDTGGPAGVRAMWFSGRPPNGEPLWSVLGRVLDAGSVMEDGAVTAPYVFGAWPDSVDHFSYVAVVGESIAARTAPSDTAAVAALVSHLIVPMSGPPAGGFQPVRLPDGADAFVPVRAAMSPVGYRAGFWDDGDGWKLQTFLAGD